MTAAAKKLLEQVLALPEDELSRLVNEAASRLPDVELEPELHAVVKGRIQEIEDGDVELLTSEEVEREVDEALEAARRARHA